MPARKIDSGTNDYAAKCGEHDLIFLLKEVISSLKNLCTQKEQIVYLDSCPSKVMSLDSDSLFVLVRRLITNISCVACKGAMIKISVFNCENEVIILFEYGARSHYHREKLSPESKKLSAKKSDPFTSSVGLDLLELKNLAGQLTWNLWTGGAVKNRGTRVFLSTQV